MTLVAHVDLLVTDVERALSFYVGILGATVVDDATVRIPSLPLLSPGAPEHLRIVLLQLPGPGIRKTTIELMKLEDTGTPTRARQPTADAPLPALWFSVVVDDLEACLAMMEAKGVPALTPIETVQMPRAGSCRVAFIRDFDGNLIELMDTPKGPIVKR